MTQCAGTAVPPHKPRAKMQRRQRLDRLLALGALLTLALAWVVGAARAAPPVTPALLAEALPGATRFEPLGGEVFAGFAADGTAAGYVAVGQAGGYGGPLQVAAGVDTQGVVQGTAVLSHKETPTYFDRVLGSGFLNDLRGKAYDDPFALGTDLDGISGATYSAAGLAAATQQAATAVAVQQLGLPRPPGAPIPIKFGIPEITLILLFGAGYLGHRPKFKYTKQVRWATLLTGLIVLGFWYNQPLTISRISSFLLGFWPQWQTNLYWYLLVGGIFLVATVDNKNAYCAWFCPFGAAQECMGAIGGAKYNVPRQYRYALMWVTRGLAWLALLLAFLFRNPGISSYEVFGTLFDFNGSTVLFVLLGIVLVLSLFVKRPWCNYLCPLDPVYDIIRLLRGWALELWHKIRPQTAA